MGPQAAIHLTYGPYAGSLDAEAQQGQPGRAVAELGMNSVSMTEEWQVSGLLPEPGQIHPPNPSSPGHKVTLIKDTQSLGLANSYCGSCVWTLSQLTLEKAHAQKKEGVRGLAGG